MMNQSFASGSYHTNRSFQMIPHAFLAANYSPLKQGGRISEESKGTAFLFKTMIDYIENKSLNYSLFLGLYLYEEREDMLKELITRLRCLYPDFLFWQESECSYVIHLFLPANYDPRIYDTLQTFIIQSKNYIFISIGEVFSNDEQWVDHYKQVSFSLGQRYFNTNSHIYYQSRNVITEAAISNIADVRPQLVIILHNKRGDLLQAYMDKLFSDIMERRSIGFLYLTITEIFVTYSVHYPHFMKIPYNITEFIMTLLEEDYKLVNIRDAVVDHGFICMNQTNTTPSDLMLSKKIINYINKNYREPDLSVSKLADIFHLNPSYIGNLFKKVNGESILQYITHLRMEHSKKLLLSEQYKISDIAEMVGYSDVFYFSKRFKQIYGLSPKDYARQQKRKA